MSQAGTVYGQGLYTLALEEGLEGQILEELAVLEAAFGENPEFLKLLASHNIPLQERLSLLDESFRGKVHSYVLNFLKLLTEKSHIRSFPECYKAYREQYNSDKGILEVQVFTALPLNDAQKVRLTDKLTAITGKEISEGLKKQFGLDVPKQKLVLDEPIKSFGTYQVKAKLGFEISGTVSVTVSEE